MKLNLILLIAAICLLLCACSNSIHTETLTLDSAVPGEGAELEFSKISEDRPLICSAESLEEAEEIAGIYGIELVDFSYGVACFYTEEEPWDVISRGIENGWPQLDLNHIITLDPPVGGVRIEE